jgi:polyphosphate kinase
MLPGSATDHHPSDSKLFLNRELSLLEFQRRVLEEAQDESNPLLERVKFLAILGNNMDEFYMVRVSGILKQIEAGITDVSPDGATPREQLAAIRKRAVELSEEALRCFTRKILPRLDKAGIHVLDYAKMSQAQKERVNDYFSEVVYPVLTPLALDPGHPFPHISNLSLNLAIVIKDAKGREKFARLKVPDTLPRLVPVKRSSGSVRVDGTVPHQHYFVWLEQVIAANLGLLFPGLSVVASYPFRILRDADIEIQELEAEDLIDTMEQNIRRRKFGDVVSVSINSEMPASIRELLVDNLEIDHANLFIQNSPFGLASLWQLYNSVERFDLKYPLYTPVVAKSFTNATMAGDIFDAIRQGNILLHHPYDSFNPVIDFLYAAARDPNVLAIKQALYRVGQNSPVVEALLEASERGKQVAVLVELKARFDEESNIGWARALEQQGVHVVYGLLGLKTHSKTTMVVRKEGDGIRRYLHLATGNYNGVTALVYEDLGMFTCDEAMGADATDLFNYLTGYSTKQDYRKLLVAPVNLRHRLEEFIRREMEHARAGHKARLIFKVNAVVDPPMIKLLYEASQAGVKVDLLVRGMCCLRPGVKGLSENIRVISIVGRYLEHSRIFYFLNGSKEEVYLGSADLMPRNLSHRVEVMFPLERPEHVRYICDHVLDTYLKDNLRARVMLPNGTYKRIKPSAPEDGVDSQVRLMEVATARAARKHMLTAPPEM